MKFFSYFYFISDHKIKIIFILLLILSFFLFLFDIASIFILLPIVTSLPKNNFFENQSLINNYIPDSVSSYLTHYTTVNLFYLVLVVLLIRNFLNIFNNYIILRFTKYVEIDTSKKVFYLWINNSYLNFYKKNSSEIIKDFRDSVGGYILFVENVIRLTSSLLILFLFLTFLIFISPKETFFVLLYYILIFFSFNNILSRFSFKNGKKVNVSSSKINVSILNVYKNFVEITLRKLKNKFLKIYLSNVIIFSKSRLIVSFVNLNIKQFLEILIIFFVIISLFFNTSLKMYNFNEILSLMVIFLLSAYRIMPLINNLIGARIKLKNFEFAYNIIVKILRNFNKENININFHNEKNIKLNFSDKIIFKNIFYKYQNIKNFILKNASFYIKKNEILGIFGDSGEGKTTLIHIVLGLIRPANVEILLDNKKIYKKYIYSYQNLFGFSSQENLFIPGSIKDNIAFGEDKPNISKVWRSLKDANCSQFVSRLKNDINHTVLENGKNFSHGQRQRLSLARLLYFNTDIIVLDEPTSSLDKNAERKFLNLINNLK
jgi:ABC-type bacteriocin/lantibiotic exporter with double-glycine peptidase domain